MNKKLIIILAFILFTIHAVQAQTLYLQTYPNGNTYARYYYDDDNNRTGVWQLFYEDGKLWKEVEYQNNMLSGKYREYKNDTVICTANYVKGKQHGEFIRYYSSDKKNPYIKGNFENGIMSGEWTFDEGRGKIAGKYVDNKRDGVWTRYHSNGNKRAEITYQNGKAFGPFTAYYESGEMKETGAINDKYYDGVCSTYEINGELKSQEDMSGKNKLNPYLENIENELKYIDWDILPAKYDN